MEGSTQIKITDEVVSKVESLAKELFEKVGVDVELSVSHDKESEAVLVDIKTEDSAGLIIGRRGETIMALQHVLGLMARNALDGWVRIIVNVGDWREKQEGQLKDLAMQVAERARETGEPQYLYNLESSQRRVIHMTLSEERDLTTESEGEGRDRHLVITLKK